MSGNGLNLNLNVNANTSAAEAEFQRLFAQITTASQAAISQLNVPQPGLPGAAAAAPGLATQVGDIRGRGLQAINAAGLFAASQAKTTEESNALAKAIQVARQSYLRTFQANTLIGQQLSALGVSLNRANRLNLNNIIGNANASRVGTTPEALDAFNNRITALQGQNQVDRIGAGGSQEAQKLRALQVEAATIQAQVNAALTQALAAETNYITATTEAATARSVLAAETAKFQAGQSTAAQELRAAQIAEAVARNNLAAVITRQQALSTDFIRSTTLASAAQARLAAATVAFQSGSSKAAQELRAAQRNEALARNRSGALLLLQQSGDTALQASTAQLAAARAVASAETIAFQAGNSRAAQQLQAAQRMESIARQEAAAKLATQQSGDTQLLQATVQAARAREALALATRQQALAAGATGLEQTAASVTAREKILADQQAILVAREQIAISGQVVQTSVQRRIAEAQLTNAMRLEEQKLVRAGLARNDPSIVAGTTGFQRFQSRLSGRLPSEAQTAGSFFGGRLLSTAGFAVGGAAIFGALSGVGEIVREASELERIFSRLDSQLTQLGDQESFPVIKSGILDIAEETGVAADEVAELVFQFRGAFEGTGTGAEETARSLEEASEAMKLVRVSGLETAEAIDSLTAINQSFGVGMKEVGDTAVALRGQFGVLEAEIITFSADLAPIAAQVGLSFAEVATLGAQFQQVSGRSGAAGAEAMGRILTDLGDKSSEVLSLLREELDPQAFQEIMADFGAGETGDAFLKIQAGFQGLSATTQDALLALIGGRREAQTLAALFQDPEKFNAGLDAAADSAGKMDLEFEKLQKTVQNTFRRLGESLARLGQSLFEAGIADLLKGVAGVISGTLIGPLQLLLDLFNSLNDVTGGWAAKLVAVAAAVELGSRLISRFAVAQGAAAAATQAQVVATIQQTESGLIVVTGKQAETIAHREATVAKTAEAAASERLAVANIESAAAQTASATAAATEAKNQAAATAADNAQTGSSGLAAQANAAQAASGRFGNAGAAISGFFGAGGLGGRALFQGASGALAGSGLANSFIAGGGAVGASGGKPVGGGLAVAALALFGASQVKSTFDEQDSQVGKSADALREALKTATDAELQSIIDSHNSWIENLAFGIFNEDDPQALAQAQQNINTAADATSKFDAILADPDAARGVAAAFGDLGKAQIDKINETLLEFQANGDETFGLLTDVGVGGFITPREVGLSILPSTGAGVKLEEDAVKSFTDAMTARREKLATVLDPAQLKEYDDKVAAILQDGEITVSEVRDFEVFNTGIDQNNQIGFDVSKLSTLTSEDFIKQLEANVAAGGDNAKESAVLLDVLNQALTEQASGNSALQALIDAAVDNKAAKEAIDAAGGLSNLVALTLDQAKRRLDLGLITLNEYKETLLREKDNLVDQLGVEQDAEKIRQFQEDIAEIDLEIGGIEVTQVGARVDAIATAGRFGTRGDGGNTARAQLAELVSTVGELRQSNQPIGLQVGLLPQMLDALEASITEQLDAIEDPVARAARAAQGFDISPEIQRLFILDQILKNADIQAELAPLAEALQISADEFTVSVVDTMVEQQVGIGEAIDLVLEQQLEDIDDAISALSDLPIGPRREVQAELNAKKADVKNSATDEALEDIKAMGDIIVALGDTTTDQASFLEDATEETEDISGQLELLAFDLATISSGIKDPVFLAQRALQRAQIELRQAQASGDQVGAAQADISIAQAVQQQADAMNARTLAVLQASASNAKSEPDRLTAELEIARFNLAEAQKSGNVEEQISIQAQIDDLNRQKDDANFNLVSLQSQLRQARTRDPVAIAREQLNLARQAVAQADTVEEEIQSQIDLVNAENSLSDALESVLQAQVNLAITIAQAAGDNVRATELSLQEARRKLAEALADPAAGDVELDQLRADVVAQEASARDAQFSARLEDIAFMQDIGKITTAQAIEMLESMRQIPDLTEDQLRTIERRIISLRQELGRDFQFNLPSFLGLPTLYESRRSVQGPGGYQDNRQISIVISVDGSGTPEATAREVGRQLSETLNQRSVQTGNRRY